MQLKQLTPIALALVLASAAIADESDIRKTIESKFNVKVESITKTGYLGLYEVYFDGHILYTDEKVTAILDGNLIDAKTKKSITDERMRKLTAIKFSELPLDRAIKQVKGDGKRVLATFEDPNCGYCKRLAKDLQKLDNVTIYTFLYPILSEDSVRKSRQIWCSSDRTKAWNEWMLEGKVPAGKDDCDTSAVTRNQEYGQKLNITGTPTMFFANGERVPGAMPFPQIEQRLAQSQTK